MHGVALHHPLVEYTVREIESKLEEEKASGSGYLDCFNFKNDIQTGKRTLIGMTVQAFQQLTGGKELSRPYSFLRPFSSSTTS